MRAYLVAVSLMLGSMAFGQNGAQVPPNQTRIVGTIESLNGQILVVKSQDGQTSAVTLSPQVSVVKNEKGTLADIKEGTFVGSAAVKGPDGKLHAEEVHIFAESMRGTGEGHRPMGPDANRTMTNATVAAVERTMTNATVSNVSGTAQAQVLKLKYKEGEQEIVVAPDTPITLMTSGDLSLLKPGTLVTVVGTKTESGTTARIVQINPRQSR